MLHKFIIEAESESKTRIGSRIHLRRWMNYVRLSKNLFI